MARLDEQRRQLAVSIRLNRAAENELTPSQARLFVRSLQTSWHVPQIAWSARESREQFDDARRLLHAASIFLEIDGPESAGALGCYRRAGELFEWLARASDDVTRDVPVGLLSAGAYQLAGLPAMATSLLRRGGYGGGVAEIFAAFLSADFERLLARSSAFWNDHPDLTGRYGSASLLDEGGDDDREDDEPGLDADGRHQGAPEAVDPASRVGWYVVVELVRTVGLFADSIRRGNDERLALSLDKLSDLSAMATRLSSDELWVLINLIEATAKRFSSNSLHTRVSRLAAHAPNYQQRMWRFAREQFARGRGILWTSQVQGLERLIESDSFALCTPTGSGKTLIANLALVKELLLVEPGEQAPLAIYLVPSRALASEVEAKLTAELGDELIVTGLYGGADWGITDYWLTGARPVVLIATVEKAEALMRYVGHLLVRRIRLLVIDEAHQVVDDGDIKSMQDLAAHRSRSMRLEAMVSRLLVAKPNMACIALTAVAGGAALPVAQWIERNIDATPVGAGYRSSRQIIGALQCEPRRAPQAMLDVMNGQVLYVRGRDAPVYLPMRIPMMQLPASSVRNSLPHYTQIYVLWTALHLLDGNRRILISVMQSPERLMKRFAEAFALPGWENLQPFVPPPDPALHARFEETRATCIDYCGVDSYELALLDRGIATSHGQMPQRLRRLMTALIDYRICPITLATATLTEGVNLPFDIIFITSLERRSFDPHTGQPVVVPMPTSEFRNLAGRAGRPGAAESIEGMTLVALSQAPSTTAAGSRPQQLAQIRRANEDYNDLLSRLQAEDAAGGVVHSPLAVLLRSIAQKAIQLFGIQTEDQYYAWLEATLPENAGARLGVDSRTDADQLGDSLDELDGFILSATEELALFANESVDGARAEIYMRELWQRTFARVAATQEAFLEHSFIKRGRAFVERLYPNHEQRRRLYQYGFTPYVGRRFEITAPDLIAELLGATDFGALPVEDRFQLLFRLGERIRAEPCIGFRGRATAGDQAMLANWSGVCGWWMQRPGALSPEPDQLRSWQRFVTENLEFRLGVAVGAAVAQVWSKNAVGLEAPTLETWRATTGLPWIGFWFRELLRWGTLDPFVAFAMAQGLARTREEAAALRPEFEAWLTAEGFDHVPETLIDPQRFLVWQRSRIQQEAPQEIVRSSVVHLTGDNGQRNTYDVRPIVRDSDTIWLDAAGYSVARSPYSAALVTAMPERHDYRITVGPTTEVARTF